MTSRKTISEQRQALRVLIRDLEKQDKMLERAEAMLARAEPAKPVVRKPAPSRRRNGRGTATDRAMALLADGMPRTRAEIAGELDVAGQAIASALRNGVRRGELSQEGERFFVNAARHDQEGDATAMNHEPARV